MSFIITLIIEMTITTAEKKHGWGENYSRKEFIDLVKEAMDSGAVKEKDAFNYVMRAMKI